MEQLERKAKVGAEISTFLTKVRSLAVPGKDRHFLNSMSSKLAVCIESSK